MVEVSALDQLDYYLTSLGELGEILIDADKSASVGKGVLRLTLGTVMASKGAIFFISPQERPIIYFSITGVEKAKSIFFA